MIKKTYIDMDEAAATLMAKYKVSQTTAYRAKKRGYISEKIRTIKTLENLKDDFDVDLAYRAAGWVYWSSFSHINENIKCHKDDLVHDAMIKMLELSGLAEKADKKYSYLCKIARMSMWNTLKKVALAGIMKDRVDLVDNVFTGAIADSH